MHRWHDMVYLFRTRALLVLFVRSLTTASALLPRVLTSKLKHVGKTRIFGPEESKDSQLQAALHYAMEYTWCKADHGRSTHIIYMLRPSAKAWKGRCQDFPAFIVRPNISTNRCCKSRMTHNGLGKFYAPSDNPQIQTVSSSGSCSIPGALSISFPWARTVCMLWACAIIWRFTAGCRTIIGESSSCRWQM